MWQKWSFFLAIFRGFPAFFPFFLVFVALKYRFSLLFYHFYYSNLSIKFSKYFHFQTTMRPTVVSMGKHFGNLGKMYGEHRFALAPNEQKAYKGFFDQAFVKTFKTYVWDQWYYYIPQVALENWREKKFRFSMIFKLNFVIFSEKNQKFCEFEHRFTQKNRSCKPAAQFNECRFTRGFVLHVDKLEFVFSTWIWSFC